MCLRVSCYVCACVLVSVFLCVFVSLCRGQMAKEARIVCLCVCHYYAVGRSKMLSLKQDESVAEESSKALMGSEP